MALNHEKQTHCLIYIGTGWYWQNLYAKDSSEPKYEFLMKKREDAGIKDLNDLNAFIECLITIGDFYENIDDYNPNRKRKS